MKTQKCKVCMKSPLSRDECGINRKLLGKDVRTYFCLDCLARYLDCTADDLREKIKEFRDEGCELFK